MCIKGFLKRVLPFLGALSVGLFIASFFVDIASPKFGNRGVGKRYHHMKRLRVENEQLRNENLRLKNELENLRISAGHSWDYEGRKIEVPLAPPPPPAPRVNR